jgi:predicted adenine nucleotide alpha hydrolase (AANH) superfamily ATPase
MPRILLHTCCAPCTLYPYQELQGEGWAVHGFFYNPHIQPVQEFRKRLDTLRKWAEQAGLPVIVRSDYDIELFFRQIAFRENQR